VSVWQKDELDREQVRGLFAIAVLASIAVYLASRGSFNTSTSPLASSLFGYVTVLSVVLLMFWTLYVVTVAISMAYWNPKRPLSDLLRLFKGISQWCFAMGSFMTVIVAAYAFPELVYIEYTINPASLYPLLYVIGIALAAYFVLALYAWRRGLEKKGATSAT
jgi:hypothetical protein